MKPRTATTRDQMAPSVTDHAEARLQDAFGVGIAKSVATVLQERLQIQALVTPEQKHLNQQLAQGHHHHAQTLLEVSEWLVAGLRKLQQSLDGLLYFSLERRQALWTTCRRRLILNLHGADSEPRCMQR